MSQIRNTGFCALIFDLLFILSFPLNAQLRLFLFTCPSGLGDQAFYLHFRFFFNLIFFLFFLGASGGQQRYGQHSGLHSTRAAQSAHHPG
jgi:hypothetical protein